MDGTVQTQDPTVLTCNFRTNSVLAGLKNSNSTANLPDNQFQYREPGHRDTFFRATLVPTLVLYTRKSRDPRQLAGMTMRSSWHSHLSVQMQQKVNTEMS